MDYNTAYAIVDANSGKTFTITWNNGAKSTHRMFISNGGHICEFRKRSRRYGVIFGGIDNIRSIECRERKVVEPCEKFRKNVKRVIKYLSASGLWAPMLETAKIFLTLSDEELLSANKDWGSYRNLMDNKLKDYQWFGCDCFFYLFGDGAIKAVNYERWSRESDRQMVANAITNKRNYHTKWRKGYDNSIEVRFDNDYARGWYSEEYKDCGNGHYYLLLDETHAIFCEND